jgi:hypothetical protein
MKKGFSLMPTKKAFWERLRGLLTPKVYIPAFISAAAVVMIAIFLSSLGRPSARLPEFVANIEKGELISNLTRGASSPLPETSFVDPKEAALTEFRYMLKYKDDQFSLKPLSQSLAPSDSAIVAYFRMFNAKNMLLGNFKIQIPRYLVGTRKTTLWMLGIPSRDLYLISSISDTTDVKWTENMGSWGCATVVYKGDSGYRASVGFKFDLH